MPKKSFDIIPPKEKKAKVDLAPFYPKPPKKLAVAKKKTFFFVLISVGAILLFSLSYLFIEPKTEIEIWPKMTATAFETQAEIPGRELLSEETVSQEFFSSGSKEKESKAEGVITVYNNYHLDQTLVQKTRFWCFIKGDELREFKTKEKVIIPSGEHLDVEVVASLPGEEYNIPPCTFSVPGLKGSPRYTAVYGESSSPMTGGEITKVSQVTAEDLSRAKEVLTKEAFEKSKKSLEDLISSDDYIAVEGGTRQKIIESGSPAEPGEELEKFLYKVKAQTKALVLKNSELEKFAKEYILSHISEGREIQEKSLKVEYSSPEVDLEKGKFALNLKMTVNVYSSIDKDSLKEQVKGNKLEQVKQLFEGYPEIEKVQVRFWPFWVTKAPQDTKRIDIKLNI
jgi:hypothetical protein